MKQILCMALALALSAALLTGCGCTNPNVSNDPNGVITNPTTVAPSTNPMPTMTTPPEESSRETTMPTTGTTMPSEMPGENPGAVPGATGGSAPTDMTGEPEGSRGMGSRRMP